jgi:TonB-dependent starch-binding outer membrane protein SusC
MQGADKECLVFGNCPGFSSENLKELIMKNNLLREMRYCLVLYFLLLSAAGAWAQGFTVKGKVNDEKGAGVPGATILVKGTTTGTTTDANGGFSLQVPGANSTLVVSFMGYQAQEVAVNNRTTLTIALAPDAKALEEVVVVGYGTQRAQDVTGSVAPISMKNVQDQAVAGLDQAMSGQIAGVQISSSNGVPGGGPAIQVRGVGAVGAGSQPLYVVDGFPLSTTSGQTSNPINDIPPQDIESITVLKDASATAIYGSRGANGVVMITTKKGKSGKAKVQLGAYTGWQQIPDKGRPDLMNAQEFAQFRREAIGDRFRAQQNREPTDADIPEIYRNPAALGKGTDWFEEMTRVAPMQDVNLSISGGNENVSSYVSAGYFNQDGVVEGSGFERYSLRANVDTRLGNKIKAGLNLAPTFTTRKRAISGGEGRGEEGFGEGMVASPVAPVRLPDGSLNPMIQSPETFNYPNPLLVLKEVDDESRGTRVLINAYAEYDIIKDLKLRATFNTDWQQFSREYFRPSFVGRLNQPPPSVPSGRDTRGGYTNWLNENTLTYQKTIGFHALTVLGGYTIQEQTNRFSNYLGESFPDDDVRTFNAAGRISGLTNEEDWALISYLARVNYVFRDKYMLTATARRDGSSRFGFNNRWGVFPSMALGWRLSEEAFVKNLSWISELKLRASYGYSGNFEIGNYTYMSQIVSSNYLLGGGLVGGRSMGNLGNPELGWERMRELNVGLDVGLVTDRFYLSVDVYKRNTTDLLLNVEVPHSSGFAAVTENRGNVQNTGVELALTSQNIQNENFSWTSNLNFAHNKNKVLELGRSNEPILSGRTGEGNPSHITRIGQPLGLFYGYVFDGIYQNLAEVQAGPAFPGAIPGNMRMKDINGDGVINPVQDFDVIGNPHPDFTWGFTNTLTAFKFDLRVLVTGSMGAERLLTRNEYLHNIDGVFNVTRDVQDRWRSPEQPGSGRVPTTNGSGRGRVMFRDVSSLWVEKADYAWIKNITLGYTLPKPIAGVIQTARVYGSIQNAFLFTSYPGNPEVTNYGNTADPRKAGPLVPGVDYSSYPVPRVFTIGTNLTF